MPALLVVGLLAGVERHWQLPKGYYGLDSRLMRLAFMTLARLGSIEALRDEAPGEWGKLLGLDRVPEVHTRRAKIQRLAQENQPAACRAALCERWMAAAPEQAGVRYVDGHVRFYNGSQTALPRHDVAPAAVPARHHRRLGQRHGRVAVLVNQVVEPGLIAVIELQSVPLIVPLPDDPLRHHFTRVFDREGYSPDRFARLKAQQMASLTDHKFPGEPWADAAFAAQAVRLANGETVCMDLAKRGTCLSNGQWVTERRKHRVRGHQTAILSTDYRTAAAPLAAAMFARWSQENFFK